MSNTIMNWFMDYKILTEDAESKTGTVSISQYIETPIDTGCYEKSCFEFDCRNKNCFKEACYLKDCYEEGCSEKDCYEEGCYEKDCFEEGCYEKDCFRDYKYITNLKIPSSIERNGIIYTITQIESEAFWVVRELVSIVIPESVTNIGHNAFSFLCSGLANITVKEGNENYTSVDGVLFTKDMKTLLAYPCGKKDERYTIPEGVTGIAAETFQGCASLVSVTIPKGVTDIGECVFSRCENLTSIRVEEGNKNYTSVDGVLFTKDMTALVAYPPGKKEEKCTIPETVTRIASEAFYLCTSLTSIVIPESVTNIGDEAFYGCTSLVSIVIPEGVISIGDEAFYGCTSLESFTIPKSVVSISASAFNNCRSLVSITIPEGVTSIEASTFESCESLKSITIPKGVTSIGDEAFYGCTNLVSITIPESVTGIGSWGFNDCTSLKSITIPRSVTHIEGYAFSGCKSLADVYFEGPPPEMDGAFEEGTIFHYVEGTPGWTTPEWNGFETRTFDPASR